MTLQFPAKPVAGTSGSVRVASHGRLGSAACVCLLMIGMSIASTQLGAQTVTSSIQGRVYDASGAAISGASVTAVNADTGVSRTNDATSTGDYQITLLPPGDYTVTAEKSGFQKSAKKVHMDLGAAGTVDFNLPVGKVTEQVSVQDVGEVAEPTRTMVSTVIDEQKIESCRSMDASSSTSLCSHPGSQSAIPLPARQT